MADKITTIKALIERLTAGAILTASNVNLNADAKDVSRNHVKYGRLVEQLATLVAVGVSVDHGVWEDDGFLRISYLTIGGRNYIKHTVPA